MKIIKFLTCGFFSLIFINTNSYSQISNFDSSFVLISSQDFDFRNPQFDKSQNSINYFIRDCIFAYEKWSTADNSNIVVRFMNYNSLDSIVEITNNSNLNIHPSVAYFSDLPVNNEGALVYQSNINGRWEIFFTKYNQINWSQPVSITPDSVSVSDPEIVGYNLNSKNYLVTYVKGNDIYVRNYFNGIWSNEINITLDDSLICFSPKVSKSYSQNIYLTYLRKINDSVNSIAYHINQINANGDLIIGQRKDIHQENSQNNIRYSQEFSSPVLIYDYDTLDKKDVYIATNNSFGQNEFINITGQYSGNNFGGMTSTHGDITDNFYFTALCWINYKSDSLNIYAINRNTFFGIPRKFYVGDSSESTYLNLSTKLCKGINNQYRFRMIWEKKINGRTALMESYMDDYLSSLIMTSSAIPDNFSLSQNYPNPFNPSTNLEFGISELGFVSLKVYDVLGNEVATLVNETKAPGNYNYQFSTDNYQLSSGIYFYSLSVDGVMVDTKRMILLK